MTMKQVVIHGANQIALMEITAFYYVGMQRFPYVHAPIVIW